MSSLKSGPELVELDELPSGLLDYPADQLYRALPQPTLIHLPGQQSQPLFISVLLHGNETSGWTAVQRVLKKYAKHGLPRAVSLFLGNLEAARAAVRRLDWQPDYNRIWPGTELSDRPETQLAQTIFLAMARRQPLASIDLHNNTGHNPHYACVERLDAQTLALANLFGRLVIYGTRPKGTLTGAFAALCPAVTLECGTPDQADGAEHACTYFDASLQLSALPQRPPAPTAVDLYRTVAQVVIRDEIRFSYTDQSADLVLTPRLDRLNFTALPAGTVIGYVPHVMANLPCIARSEGGCDVTTEYFSVGAHRLVLTKPIVPAMFTLDERIIRQDCLGYLMEPCAY